MLALLQWMNPQWGWVLPAAVLLPLAAHLMSQRSGKLAYFPAVRFIAKAAALQARWHAPRQWLLLFLRMLILALVIAAFAQPMWWRDSQTVSQRHQGLALVLIVDASASMQRTVQGSSLFDTARTQALAALASLDPSRDRAMLIILDESPSPVLPRMSANFSTMRDALIALKPTWEVGNLAAALTLAARPAWDPADLAGTSPLAIHLFSDMQRTQWPADAQLRTILANKTFVPHDVGEAASRENLALRHVTLSTATPVRGQPVNVSVEAGYYAPHDRSPAQVNVRLTTSAGALVRRVTLAAQSSTRVSFPWLPSDAGPAYLALSIEPATGVINDTLQADNHTGLHVHVAQSQNVALVTSANVNDPASAAYYLARALTPDTDAPTNQVRLQVWPADQLATRFSDALKPVFTKSSWHDWPACIVMVETGSLDTFALNALAKYMEMGGGVWWILDSQAAADSLGQWQGNRQSDWPRDGKHGAYPMSPVLPASSQGSGASNILKQINRVDGLPHIGQGVFDQPPLDVFEGPARAALNDIYFTQTFEGVLAPEAERLLDFSHLLPDVKKQAHPPVLSWRTAGGGKLALLTAGIAPASSNLVKVPVFLPLVHQMVRSLSLRAQATYPYTPGGSAMISLDANEVAKGLYLLQPDGSRSPLPADAAATTTTWQQSQLSVPLVPLNLPGRYDVHAQSDNRLLAGVQVELAAVESDPAAELPQAALLRDSETQKNTAPSSDVTPATSSTSVVAAATIREQGRALWPYLLMLTAILLALESLISGGLLERQLAGRRARVMHQEQTHA